MDESEKHFVKEYVDLWEIVLTCARTKIEYVETSPSSGKQYQKRVIYKKHEYVQKKPTTRELADLLYRYADSRIDVLKVEIFSRNAMLSEPTDIAEK